MKKFIIIIVSSLFLVSILSKLFGVVKNNISDCPEKTKEININGNLTANHQRSWLDFNNKSNCVEFNVSEKENSNSRNAFNNYSFFDDQSIQHNEYFGNVYDSLYLLDKDKLTNLEDSLAKIGEIENLNHSEFAKMVVSFVQDIPYSYVFGSSNCEDRENKSHPCSSGNRLGLLTPVEFMYTLVGDCDTRALLLYLLLKNFGYDPVIVISLEYRHAMLAIDLPTYGDFILSNGKKYYFWETTGTGWQLGILPPSCANTAYWKIALGD